MKYFINFCRYIYCKKVTFKYNLKYEVENMKRDFRKITLILSMAFISIVLIACSANKQSKNPEDLLNGFIVSLEKDNIKKTESYLSESYKEIHMLKAEDEGITKEKADEKLLEELSLIKGLSSDDFEKVELEGYIQYEFSDEIENELVGALFILKEVDGKWNIDYIGFNRIELDPVSE